MHRASAYMSSWRRPSYQPVSDHRSRLLLEVCGSNLTRGERDAKSRKGEKQQQMCESAAKLVPRRARSAAELTQQIPPRLHPEVINGSGGGPNQMFRRGYLLPGDRSLPGASGPHFTPLSRHTPPSRPPLSLPTGMSKPRRETGREEQRRTEKNKQGETCNLCI